METNYATTYSYTILRYLHDPSTGEFANVGVALYAPEARYVSALCRTTYQRLSGMFPDINGDAFRSQMRFVQSQFEAFQDRLQAELPLSDVPRSVMEIAHGVLPHDAGSFQWSAPAGGITNDPAASLHKIFVRMVARYDEAPVASGRDDNEVRDKLRQQLQQRHIMRYLRPKTITAPHEEVEFPYAHKNGIWTCLDGVSFDLKQPDNIRKKARQWLGLAVGLHKSEERFKLCLLLAEPRQPDARQRKAFHQAIDLLDEIPVEHQLIRENQVREFSDQFAAEVKEHEGESL